MATRWRPLERHDLVSSGGRRLYVYGAFDPSFAAAPRPEVDPADLHQRFDILTGTWVAISPSRNVRPHSRVPVGAAPAATVRACPLCPRGPEVPFPYQAAVFDNRFPAFVDDAPRPVASPPVVPSPLVSPSRGRCEVVLYTDRHQGSLASLTPDELARVVAVWRDRTAALWSDPGHSFVMAFENRGHAIGATLSHPHGQIYAFDHLPPLIAARIDALVAHRTAEAACGSCAVVAMDDAGERVVAANPSFVIAVPFAARWPYEVHVRARRHGLRRLSDLGPDEQRDLAAALREVVQRYAGVFDFELPYMMVALEAPAGADDWHLAFEFYPPNRSASLTKVRASVETATGLFILDTLPEVTAAKLAGLAGPGVDEAAPYLAGSRGGDATDATGADAAGGDAAPS